MEQRSISKKVCLLGDSGVGKTSLIRRYVHNQFDDMYVMTFGAKVSSKNIRLYTETEEILVTLSIWDIVGDHSRRSLQEKHFDNASGGLIVCDCTRDITYEHLGDWVNTFRKIVPDGKLIFLLNKIDIRDKAVVSIEDLSETARRYHGKYFETSAKTGENVEMAFRTLAEKMVT